MMVDKTKLNKYRYINLNFKKYYTIKIFLRKCTSYFITPHDKFILRYYWNENKKYLFQFLLIFLFIYFDFDYYVYELLNKLPNDVEYLHDFIYINGEASFTFNLYFTDCKPIQVFIEIDLESSTINFTIIKF